MVKVYFQIGTNDGNDLFLEKVKEDKPDLVILVEPLKELEGLIKENYKGLDNVLLYSNAIYYKDDETVELYIPAKNGIMGNVASNGITYSKSHFSLLPMNDWGDKKDMVKYATKTITFDTICKNHNITEIEYLQIDTEGFDSEIIKMIDFDKYKIKTIRFEKWEFDTWCFSRYNEDKWKELGKNGTQNSINKLLKYGYTVKDVRDKMGNDVIATLEE